MGIILFTLLAARDHTVSFVVFRMETDGIFACVHIFGYVKLEGDIAALVAADILTIDINFCAVVNSAEVEEDSSRKLFL